MNADIDYSKGLAITSSIYPDDRTHIEPVRYPEGSNAMGLLSTILVDGGGRVPRQLRFVGQALRHPTLFIRSLSVRRWSERTVILLVMQSADNSLNMIWKRRRNGSLKLTTEQGEGDPNPTYIPIANEAARIAAEIMDGQAGSAINEVLLDVPTTAHILGGACIGDSAETGVVDGYQRVFGHPGLSIAGRVDHQRQPGSEPVADHHRADGAGHVALAQQGRTRPAPATRGGVCASGSGGSSIAGRPTPCAGGACLGLEPTLQSKARRA